MTDTKKFLIMKQEFLDVYENAQSFAKKLGHNRDTSVNNWLNGRTVNIRGVTKAKIIEIFELPHDVWMKEFNRDESFRKYLQTLKTKKEDNFDDLLFEKLAEITTKEREILMKKLEEDIDFKQIKSSTPSFMFEYAQKLQKEDKIEEALEVLKILENDPSSYKIIHANQIDKLKAILLSDKKIQDWDGAITILKRLYLNENYLINDPEVTTLIASNYKRKAFYSHNKKSLLPKEEIDLNLLIASIAIHKKAYKGKDSQDKYYDAINMAYLYNILNAIEVEDADSIEINQLYTELSKGWKINDNDWWATISNAEFLMLLGKINLAISEIEAFIINNPNKLTPSDLNPTLRQLEIYIHFTGDDNAVVFYEFLRDCLGERG